MSGKTPWFRRRTYAHFDLPCSEAEAVALADDPTRVCQHAFYPFIAFELSMRRFRGGVVRPKKKRPLRIAAHRDSHIFARYAWHLGLAYESAIKGTDLEKCVLAYRRGRGSTIDFANEAFNEIVRQKDCVAVALDLQSFFDNIDHHVLKQQWARVIGVVQLPADHYAVYRAMTRYAWVDRAACFAALGIDEDDVPRPLCDAAAFRARIRGAGLIQINKKPFGIPQGSPMSAVLSNIYMLPFDEAMSATAKKIGGFYRRYCDDILWIVKPEYRDFIVEEVGESLKLQGGELHINSAKTTVSAFVWGSLATGDPLLQYLGFTFDGSVRRLRPQTLSKFWRKVVYGVRAAKRRARKAALKGGDGRLYKRKIYRRFTHLGKRNFLTYARRAWAEAGGEGIRAQLRRHWKRVQEEIERPLT